MPFKTTLNLKTLIEHKQKLIKLILDKTGINIEISSNQGHYFKGEFDRIFMSTQYSDYKDRLLYFHYFLTQIEKVKTHSKKNFNMYLEKLKTDGTNLLGEKFEILTYARLIDKNIIFSKPKHNPDFYIKTGNGNIFIECGTRQADKNGYYIESIEDVIMKKQMKGIEQKYANMDTALHIEISRTVYNSHIHERGLDTTILKNIITKMISKVDFGAIVLINTFYALEDGIVYGEPIIEYNKNYNFELEKLHNAILNIESKRITKVFKSHI